MDATRERPTASRILRLGLVTGLWAAALFGCSCVAVAILWLSLGTSGLIAAGILLAGCLVAVSLRWPSLRIALLLAATAFTPVMWLFLDVSIHGLL